MIPAAGDEHQIARKRTGVRARLAQQVRPHDGGERALSGGRADRVDPHQHDVLRRQPEGRNALERAVDGVVGEVGRDQRVPRAAVPRDQHVPRAGDQLQLTGDSSGQPGAAKHP